MNTRHLISTGYLACLIALALSTGCASNSVSRAYFTKGGLATAVLGDTIHDSRRIHRSNFTTPEDAFLAENGRVYIKANGRLAGDTTNRTYILELPVQKKAEVTKEYFEKHHHFSAIQFPRSTRLRIHTRTTKWKRAKQNQVKELPILAVQETHCSKLKHIAGVEQVIFKPPSAFGYGQPEPVAGEHLYWVWFSASPAIYTKGWLKVFFPVTYLFDVVSSPIQIPLLKYLNSKT